MSLETFEDRIPDNVRGKIYVDKQCTDCEMCQHLAPGCFRRNQDAYSIVYCQPQTELEVRKVREAIESCPTAAIHDDGDQYNWDAFPAKRG